MEGRLLLSKTFFRHAAKKTTSMNLYMFASGLKTNKKIFRYGESNPGLLGESEVC